MVTSCFFCQNLLSDFIEGILPSARHEELKKHLDGCKACTAIHEDLGNTIKLLHSLPPRPLTHEMALRITEASTARRTVFMSSRRLSKGAFFLAMPLLILVALSYTFPNLFPWISAWRMQRSESQFVRYSPLTNGAADILEEQSTWLHSRENLMGSLWEEGGLSPEEFEKSFQVKPFSKGEEKAKGH